MCPIHNKKHVGYEINEVLEKNNTKDILTKFSNG